MSLTDPTWRYEICAKDGTNVAVITRVRGRECTPQPLNGMPTAKGNVRIDHQLGNRILALDGALLKVYRDDTLSYIGPFIAAEEAADGQGGNIAFSSAGPWWRMTHRLLGRAVDGLLRGVGYTEGTPLSPVDKSTLGQHIVENANTVWDTGIRIGTITASGNGYVGPWYFRVVADAFNEISATLGGFDFQVIPSEPTADAGGIKIGTINIVPALGTDRHTGANAIIFEYGTGKRNIASYSRARTLDGLSNDPVSLPPGFPDSHDLGTGPTVTSLSMAASRAAHGLHEALVAGDLSVDAYRQMLVDEHARIRSVPREIITMVPTKTAKRGYAFGAPAPAGGFTTGDIIQARASIAGQTRFDAAMRVYGGTFAIDDNTGAERLSIPLVPS